jgi:hypothetical protein
MTVTVEGSMSDADDWIAALPEPRRSDIVEAGA